MSWDPAWRKVRHSPPARVCLLRTLWGTASGSTRPGLGGAVSAEQTPPTQPRASKWQPLVASKPRFGPCSGAVKGAGSHSGGLSRGSQKGSFQICLSPGLIVVHVLSICPRWSDFSPCCDLPAGGLPTKNSLLAKWQEAQEAQDPMGKARIALF